jgi:hypothetical protein
VSSFDDIATRVLAFIDSSSDASCSGADLSGNGDVIAAAAQADDEFSRLAVDVFAMQYRENARYRAFCDRRGVSADSIDDWRSIPAVPTSAFKVLDLACAPPEKVFLTSGTTRGRAARGRHLVPRLELYRRSALAMFRRAVLVDRMRPRIVALLAPPRLLPDSSLSQMIEWLANDLAGGDVEYLVDEKGFAASRAADRIRAAATGAEPLCLIGLRVLFTRLIEYCRSSGQSLCLPADSRIVDTGGSKGGRALSDAGFLAACWHTFGVAGYYCVNEYGMTELCSQFYDDVLLTRFAGSNTPRRKIGPAWVRTIAVDPATLLPVPHGEAGLLRHVDLANAGSVVAVQTEDLGITHPNGFELLGRAPGAEPRGCALALADLLGAA